MNTAMPKGSNGKYNVLYRSTFSLHADKKPEDLTPKSTVMTQNKEKCAAGYKCNADSMPLSKLHRCVICAFCLHPECGYELSETPSYKTPSSSINLICQACSIGGDLAKFVNNNEISLGLYKLNRFLWPEYPKVTLSEAKPETDEDPGNKAASDNPSSDKSKSTDGTTPMERNHNLKTTTISL